MAVGAILGGFFWPYVYFGPILDQQSKNRCLWAFHFGFSATIGRLT